MGLRLESDLERLNMLQKIEKFHRSREPSWGKAKKGKKRTLELSPAGNPIKYLKRP